MSHALHEIRVMLDVFLFCLMTILLLKFSVDVLSLYHSSLIARADYFIMDFGWYCGIQAQFYLFGLCTLFTLNTAASFIKNSPSGGFYPQSIYVAFMVLISVVLVMLPITLNLMLLKKIKHTQAVWPHYFLWLQNILSMLSIAALLVGGLMRGHLLKSSIPVIAKIMEKWGFILLSFELLTYLINRMGCYLWQHHSWLGAIHDTEQAFVANITSWLPIVIFTAVAAITRLTIEPSHLTDVGPSKTSGVYGNAKFASHQQLKKYYKPENGIPQALDLNHKLMHLPLFNKLTIAAPGTGKTIASSIPVLLSYNGPILALDIKGELCLVTARYRAEVLKRDIVIIDPYQITKTFQATLKHRVVKEDCFNPLDWIPPEETQRDRLVTSLTQALIIHHEGTNPHFDESAKILIRGIVDYLVKTPEENNLCLLYDMVTQDKTSLNQVYQAMQTVGGRAAAAANQMQKISAEERGSILSTTLRQIDWLSDVNIQRLLSHSNFDLRDFLTGNMDIYVVLPPDQIKEHGRLFRMILSSLMSLITQAKPEDLPSHKILFLLEELAQLGYCPDVEQAIEVLRSRGVVVWAVFQSLKQIHLFKKPDLFKSMAIKQVFATDDIETMRWIQSLAGQKTVISKTISQDKHKSQRFGGKYSESCQERGVDLIPLNNIRELPDDEQYLIIHGQKFIHCKKLVYFSHPFFKGKFDINPLERKQ